MSIMLAPMAAPTNPVRYSVGVAKDSRNGWLCYTWAHVVTVMTGAYGTYRDQDANNIYYRQAYLVGENNDGAPTTINATSTITIDSTTLKIQIQGYDPRFSDGSDQSKWSTLNLGAYQLRTAKANDFISLSKGNYTSNKTGYALQVGTQTHNTELELYQCNYTGGPIGDAGTNNNSHIILDGAT